MPSIGDLYYTEKVPWRDRTLVIARASFAAQAAYRFHLESEARALISRHRSSMDSVEYKVQIAAWQEAGSAKVYDYNTETWARSLASRENTVKWFHLIVTQDNIKGEPSPNAGLTLEEMEKAWDEVGEAISEAWARLREIEAASDPTEAVEAAKASVARAQAALAEVQKWAAEKAAA